MKWFIHSLKNTFNYQGRARRAEYGWFILTNLLLQLGFQLVMFVVAMLLLSFGSPNNSSGLVAVGISIVMVLVGLVIFAYALVVMMAMISLTARRLHDLGWSGWWQLAVYLPTILISIATFVSMVSFIGLDASKYGRGPNERNSQYVHLF